MLAIILTVALAADGGMPYYELPEGTFVDLRDGDGPFPIAKSYLLPVPTFDAVNAELRRLQEAPAPQPEIQVPVKAYLIMAGVVATAFLAGGMGLGFYIRDQQGKK